MNNYEEVRTVCWMECKLMTHQHADSAVGEIQAQLVLGKKELAPSSLESEG